MPQAGMSFMATRMPDGNAHGQVCAREGSSIEVDAVRGTVVA